MLVDQRPAHVQMQIGEPQKDAGGYFFGDAVAKGAVPEVVTVPSSLVTLVMCPRAHPRRTGPQFKNGSREYSM